MLLMDQNKLYLYNHRKQNQDMVQLVYEHRYMFVENQEYERQ